MGCCVLCRKLTSNRSQSISAPKSGEPCEIDGRKQNELGEQGNGKIPDSRVEARRNLFASRSQSG